MSLSILNYRSSFWRAALLLLVSASLAAAQTTAFSYTGQLSDGGLPANGDYDFEFKLFDDLSQGAQHGATLQRLNIAVNNGVYTVTLDYGAAVFTEKDRFLEISYRAAGGGGAFTVLSPRQQILSVPYAIKSLGAASADTLSVDCVNCVSSSQISSVNGNTVTGAIPLASLPAGSGNYIQNTTSQQASANFNISGTGTAGSFNATTQYNIGGNRVLSAGGGNIFAGIQAGGVSTTGNFNSFFGTSAGLSSTTGYSNSLFGYASGVANTTGDYNSFFGYASGFANNAGDYNSFFGAWAGHENTTGFNNSFFGGLAGYSNSTGQRNSFFGYYAGYSNTTGTFNSFFGTSAGQSNTTGGSNAFFGDLAGASTTTGGSNSFFGHFSGGSNKTGGANSFFGSEAGLYNITGNNNSFFGSRAGHSNTEGETNSFFGSSAGYQNTTGSGNAFFGKEAGEHNTSGGNNAFFGKEAGFLNDTGGDNAFFGYQAGQANTTGAFNTFFGAFAGDTNSTGNYNTIIGQNADVASGNLNFATAIGGGATVSTSNTVVIGRSSDSVRMPGSLVVTTLGSAGSTPLCRNASNQLATCSSSLRYKTDARPFRGGLDLVKRLRPITFTWRDGAMRDLGFGAEEVEKIEPLLATRNDNGEIEGVKYAQLTTVLVNAVNEQQAQMEQYRKQLAGQQSEIAALKQLLCRGHAKAAVCHSAKRARR